MTNELLNYYVDTIKQMHNTVAEPGDFPDLKQTVIGWTEFVKDELSPENAAKLHALVEALPDQLTLLHGDYHTNNIMIQNGEAILIDMDTLATGHPIIELASMYNAFKGFAETNPENTMKFFGFPYELGARFWDLALARYLGTDDPAVLKDVENKARIIGSTRILRRSMRRQEPDREQVIANAKKNLAELIPQVDTLDF